MKDLKEMCAIIYERLDRKKEPWEYITDFGFLIMTAVATGVAIMFCFIIFIMIGSVLLAMFNVPCALHLLSRIQLSLQ